MNRCPVGCTSRFRKLAAYARRRLRAANLDDHIGVAGGTQGDASSRLPDGMLPAASARLSWDAAGSSFGPSPQLRADNVLKSSSVATAWRCFHQQHCEDDMVMKLRRNLVAVVVMALFCVVHLYLLSFRGASLSFGSTQRSPSSLSALNMSAEALLGDALWPPKVQDIPRRGQDRRIDVNLASRSIIARSNGDRAPSPALKLRQRLSDVFLKVGISARAAAMQGGRVVALALQDSFGPFPRLNASSVWRRVAWIGVGVFLLDHFLFV